MDSAATAPREWFSDELSSMNPNPAEKATLAFRQLPGGERVPWGNAPRTECHRPRDLEEVVDGQRPPVCRSSNGVADSDGAGGRPSRQRHFIHPNVPITGAQGPIVGAPQFSHRPA